MAGGIDWFRWHHGSVTDPKFQLVARRAGASLPDVLAVWSYLLEQASASEKRGDFGQIDCEAIDCMFGFPSTETRTADILKAMQQRDLITDSQVIAWDRRQPKREDDTANERKRRQREREHAERIAASVTGETSRNDTQCHAEVTHCHARGEESREEGNTSPDGDGDEADASSVDTCPQQRIITAFHAALPMARHVKDWTPARQQLLRSRWREDKKRQSLEWWIRFFAYVAQSRFLTGQTATPGRRPFELGLEWLLKAENFAKVREGAFHEAEEVAA